jgi:head-tail adaptor
MSAVFQSLLNRDYRAWRPVRTDDGRGGWLISYSLIGTLRGRMRPMTGNEMTQAAQEQRQISHRLYVEAADAIGTQIRREWLVDDGTNGFLVEVFWACASRREPVSIWKSTVGNGSWATVRFWWDHERCSGVGYG